MAKATAASSARAPRVAANATTTRHRSARPTPDADIDFSDIPELTTAALRSARRVGRPPVDGITKRLIAIRIRPDILDALRRQAAKRKQPYQTYIHEILARAAKRT